MSHNEKTSQYIETDPEMTKTIEFVCKDINSFFINAIYTFKKLKKR